MLAFQHRQASLRCWRIVRALFCLIPSGIMSMMSCITDARNSRSKWDSTLCFVTVLATPCKAKKGSLRLRHGDGVTGSTKTRVYANRRGEPPYLFTRLHCFVNFTGKQKTFHIKLFGQDNHGWLARNTTLAVSDSSVQFHSYRACVFHSDCHALPVAPISACWRRGPRINPFEPSTRLDRPQGPFFKCSVWPDRESNSAYRLWWQVFNSAVPRPWYRQYWFQTTQVYWSNG